MSTLCIVTHVRNEQFIISDWCETHKYADELLVIDTGSDDDTVAIAQQSGAHIGHADINQGFDVVRTACIDQARELGCEWLVILDADERLFRWVPEMTLKCEETPVDMTTEWPAGPGAPSHARYETVRTGRMIHQEGIIRGAIDNPEMVAYRTRRRHWFDLNMMRPCQSWIDWDGGDGVPDWQMRMLKTVPGMHYVRKIHEWLRDANDNEPEPSGAFGPDGPFFDHFHVPFKRLTPGRAEEVTALCGRLYESDTEHRGVTY